MGPERSFARWFKANGHGFIQYEDTTSVPDLVGSAHGIVLDLGAGIGNQIQRFDKAKVQHIFGVEPNTSFAAVLTDRIKELGWEGKYTPVFCAVEDATELKKHGIVPGSVDCVVCMQVLCSVDKPAAVARELYSLLKPGGELLFWEHHRSTDRLTRIFQWLWSSVWSLSLAGCRLDRPVKDAFLRAGDWELVQIDEDKDGALIMPRVWGKLVKRSV
ncbi:putative methyltransferase type 11 protein [Phaeoacremonium minimum UCRPA7]|uniref:Putative methyltransferase type 11 protein n=1 Tax=Phaeoacremonium minimum (strain UCR-PA7) TaxID=1286976 RepID=R8BVV6_PHAM7|nr:putative methyltransferase type 11 protein [Phaeoacremonium minimum UCRPA7]EOO03488.1 putative methyltransferase type 11 protein [Phaeoacremonium minimum UCRPA7]